jgi:serine protease Do
MQRFLAALTFAGLLAATPGFAQTASCQPRPARQGDLSVSAGGLPGHDDRCDHDTIAAMVARVSPAVVRVITVRPVTRTEPAQSGAMTGAVATNLGTSMATGSGYIIDPSGYIGTNRHVIDGAMSVFVVTADGVRYPATIVGMPSQADMALLRIDPGRKRLPFVTFGDSNKVRVGDMVVAIGSPFGFDQTATAGIISALNRDIMESPFDDYLQTDAAINHGNSGGPLFNLDGEVIGMTSVIYSPGAGSSGVGFALPSSSLEFVFGRLMRTGIIGAGRLPIHTQQVTWMLRQALDLPDPRGAIVTSVQDDDEAMLRGRLKAGDDIRTFNGEDVLDPRDLARKVARATAGSDATLGIYRGGEVLTVHVTIQPWPEETPIVLNNDGPRTIGLDLASVRDSDRAPIVTVAAVDPTGTAADSGIQKGDVIVQVQQTPVSAPDQALRILQARSSLRQHFAAVLVERDKHLFWLSLAVPD